MDLLPQGIPAHEWREKQSLKRAGRVQPTWQSAISFVTTNLPEICRGYEAMALMAKKIVIISDPASEIPVFKLTLPDDIIVIMSKGSNGWKISVIAPEPIDRDFLGLFIPSRLEEPGACQGFEREWVFDSILQDPCRFTVGVLTDYQAYTFLMILVRGKTVVDF